MTYAQKMMDECRIGYLDGREDGRMEGLEGGMEKGMEEGLKKAVMALRGVLNPAVIAEHFKMSVEQVMDILGQK